MNKTAIKNFAVWARNKLIADITYKAGLIGVSEKGIAQPLPQSSKDLQFFDIGTKDYAQVEGKDIEQRNALVRAIQEKGANGDYATAFKSVVEEVAYTWFNRLIAIRFMEVNEYLPSRIRVLSSENPAKNEPDFVTTPFDTDMEFTAEEQNKIMQLKDENKLDDLFRMLFIKQCNKLYEILPELFEETNNYTELLLSISFTDSDGVVYHLVHDIDEDDFNVEKEGQVEIIGWLYQYYNIEPKDETFALLKKNVKITKERIPAATQLFTPDWIVRYMVENSLGRLWVEGHPSDSLKESWKYYLEEAEQEADVQAQLEQIRAEYRNLNPEDIKVIDPCMGSGHILVYCFDVLMQIYESQGYTQRDAAQSILENNLFGLDIDKRAAQLAYFAVMMKARQYDRRIFNREIKPHVYAIEESNGINRGHLQYFGANLSSIEKNKAKLQITGLLDTMVDAKEYGSILNVENYDWDLLLQFAVNIDDAGQMTFDTVGIDETQKKLLFLIRLGQVMAQKYDAVVTNPPYMGASGMGSKLTKFVKDNYPDTKSDMFACCIEKGFNMAKKSGFVSMITMESWMFLTSFEKMRQSIVSSKSIVNMVHMPYLGKGGTSLGINFGTAAFVIHNSRIPKYSAQYDYIRHYETDTAGVPFVFPTINERYTTATTDNFSQIPGSPIAYWVGKNVFKAFAEATPLSKKADVKVGLQTGDNNRFLRLWFELDYNKITFNSHDGSDVSWVPHNKAGDFRKWYGNGAYVVNWSNNGSSIKACSGSRPQNLSYYFRAGFSWSDVSSGAMSVRYWPSGCIFDTCAPTMFPFDDSYYLLGLLNTPIGQSIMDRVSFTPNYLYKFYWLNEIENEVKDKKLIDSNEQKFSTLKNNQLWFALPKYQNDPYEFKGMYLDRERLYAIGVQSEGIDEVEKKFQNVPICCFVANSSTNMPMWAHYANNHRGYCVKYKVHNKYAVRSVMYEANRIPIATIFTNFITAAKKLDEGIGKIEDVQFYSNILQEMLFIKHESWSAEKEFRSVYPTEKPIKRGLYVGVKDVGLEVSEIICGYKCSEEHISKLAQIAKSLGVPCTRCKLSETDFLVYSEVKKSNG